MKKTVVVVTSMFAILLSACSQIPGFAATPATKPNVNTAATSDAQFKTAVVETLTAQPTLPGPVFTDTPAVLVASSVTATEFATFTPIASFTAVPNLTTTPATATSGALSSASLTPTRATATATLAPGQVTASPTNGILKYGTQPPAVPFNQITLINKSKAEAYISLHVDLQNGSNSVLEYPVEGTRKIKAPIGPYRYVAWVGGRKMMGSFRLTATDDITIILYKDRVVIK